MISSYAKKLSTKALTNRLSRQPFNTIIINELSRRANKVHKCKIEAFKRLERERIKTKLSFGYKHEAYFTEKEALATPIYRFDNLSSSEKKIYNGTIKSCRI